MITALDSNIPKINTCGKLDPGLDTGIANIDTDGIPSAYFSSLKTRPVHFTSPTLDFSLHAKELEEAVHKLREFQDNYHVYYPLFNLEVVKDNQPVQINSSMFDTTALQKVVADKKQRLQTWINQTLEFFNQLTLASKRRKSSLSAAAPPMSNDSSSSCTSDPSWQLISSEHDFDPTLDREQRAYFSFLRGCIYNTIPQFSEAAELNLQRAVKLNPQLDKASIELGLCEFKKNSSSRLDDAKLSFERALSQKRSSDALRHLSTLLRQLPTKSSAAALSNLEASITLLKEAVRADITNGNLWLGLAFAYMRQFFSFSLLLTDLKSSLGAFQRALKDPKCVHLADLYYSRASIYCYLEQYDMAVADYERAFACDPAIALEQVIPSKQLVESSSKLVQLIEKNANLKPKRFMQLLEKLRGPPPSYLVEGKLSITSYLPTTDSLEHKKQEITYTVVSNFSSLELINDIEDLLNGVVSPNTGTAFRCVIIGEISSQSIFRSFIGIDAMSQVFAISVFNIAPESIKVGDELLITNPLVQPISIHVQFRSKSAQPVKAAYRTLRVEDPQHTLVNGRVLGNKNAAWTRLSCNIR